MTMTGMVCAATSLAVALALAAVSPAQPTQPPAIPIGVLVGLHRAGVEGERSEKGDSDPPSVGRLRTLWISGLTTSKPAEAVELAHLLVPRKNGFWRMGLLGECAEEKESDFEDKLLGMGITVADHPGSAPVGTAPRVPLTKPDYWSKLHPAPCVSRNVYCVNDWTTNVYWVWPDFASLEMGSRAGCGVHPDWEPGYTVRSLSDLSKPLAVADVLAKPAEDSFKRAFQRTEKQEPECAERATFEPDSWYVERHEGGWKAIGWSTTHRLCGYGFDYTVDVDLAQMAGTRDDRSRWQLLRKQLPQLTDVHVSPGDRWTLVVTETELMIVEGSAVNRPLLKMARSSDEDVVIVEWATGRNVARWDAEVARVRGMKDPAPRVVPRER